MTGTTQPRQPKGVPVGGQWAPMGRPEASLPGLPGLPGLADEAAPAETKPVSFAGCTREERTRALMAEIDQQLDKLSDPEAWQRWLDAQAVFHHYSWGNVLLILAQRPDATQVAGFHTWKAVGRHVRKGEAAIWIRAPIVAGQDWRRRKQASLRPTSDERPEDELDFAPVLGFKSVPVFDIAQTNGPPLPERPKHDIIDHGEAPPGMVEDLSQMAERLGFALRHSADCRPALAHTNFASHEIVVDPELPPASQAKALAHELAHITLGHGKRIAEYHTDMRSDMEIEADSVAYVVSRHYGLPPTDTTAAYLDSWARGDRKRIAATAQTVQTAVRKLLDDLDQERAKREEGQA